MTPPAADRHPHPAALETETLLRSCELRSSRASGPGGQRRNKVETGIVLVHLPSGIRADATERRSRAENRSVAIRRLRIALAVNHRSSAPPGSPSELWRSRCHNRRLSISVSHTDFPAMLAEALDVVMDLNGDVSSAADRLDVTASQLLRFLKREPAALRLVNWHRRANGQRPLNP